MSKRAIFIDIDGCIIAENGAVSEDYYSSLFKLSEWIKREWQGEPAVRICSNRDQNSAEIIAKLLGIINCWMIIEKGVAIFNPTTKEIKFNPAINSKKTNTLKWISRKIIPEVLKDYSCLSLYPGALLSICLEKKPGSLLDIERIYLRVRQKLARYIRKKLIKINFFNQVIIILPAGVSKGSGIEFLSQIEKINLAESLAIGDSKQDISMFRKTKFCGCPSNSDEICKKFIKIRRGRISPKNYAEGVIDIIEWYFGS